MATAVGNPVGKEQQNLPLAVTDDEESNPHPSDLEPTGRGYPGTRDSGRFEKGVSWMTPTFHASRSCCAARSEGGVPRAGPESREFRGGATILVPTDGPKLALASTAASTLGEHL